MYNFLKELNILHCCQNSQNRQSILSKYFKNTYVLSSVEKTIKFYTALHKQNTYIDGIVLHLDEKNVSLNIEKIILEIRKINNHITIIVDHTYIIEYKTSYNVTFHYNPENNIESLLNNVYIDIKKYKSMTIDENNLYNHLGIFNNLTLVSKTDIKGVITFVNDAFCHNTGFSKDELIGQPHNIVRHPEMRKEVFSEMWKIIQQGQVWHGKLKSIDKHKNTYWVKATIFPIFDKSNNIIEYISIRFLTTEDEHKAIEIRKKNLKMIVQNRKKEYNLRKRISELEDKINTNYLNKLENKSNELESINKNLIYQIQKLENELIISRNNESNSINNTVNRFRNIQKELHSTNNKCKILSTTISSQKYEITRYKEQIAVLENKIHELNNQIKQDSIALNMKDLKLKNLATSNKRKKLF